MTAYQTELMEIVKQSKPDLETTELQALAMLLYERIKIALDENRERANKK